jgi:hypothetical protein
VRAANFWHNAAVLYFTLKAVKSLMRGLGDFSLYFFIPQSPGENFSGGVDRTPYAATLWLYP